MFLSRAGDGLKLLFRTGNDPTRHGDSFRAIARHGQELTGIRIDQSGKDPARLLLRRGWVSQWATGSETRKGRVQDHDMEGRAHVRHSHYSIR